MEGLADGLTAPATATDQRGITIQANAIEPFGQKHRTTVSHEHGALITVPAYRNKSWDDTERG
jgi:hypothetical protein